MAKEIGTAKVYEIETAVINGRKAWRYYIDTPLGNIHIVQYEKPDLSLNRKCFDENEAIAKTAFKNACIELLK